MTLSPESLKWAFHSIDAHSDGDLFPRIDEITAIKARCAEFAAEFSNQPLSNFPPGPHRRFIVPKDEISYRQATQLEPQDSIILSAIMYQFGSGIEFRRRATNQVFSYRFAPTEENGFYGSQNGWNRFWERAKTLGGTAGAILYCDISDFYNQVYHHTVENQLYESGFPNQAVKWIIALIESTTAGVSRGVPIGPHAAHLIAEASLIPIDNAMDALGIRFIRYADDIIVFGESIKSAKRDLGLIASILDKQQRLTLQRHKTQFYTRGEFRRYCQSMMEDRSISEDEESILDIVDKYSDHSPYKMISYNDISNEDWEALSDELLSGVIEEYLDDLEPDYIRLRWFYRRLAQIGHPGALEITLARMDDLTPCFANVCLYISRIQNLTDEQWKNSGSALLTLLDRDEIKESEYFRLSILNLFSKNSHINHFQALSRRFSGSDSFAKREIILAAKISGAVDWLRGFKEDFQGMDHWQKLAFIYACHDMPRDERQFFTRLWNSDRPFDKQLAAWARSGN